MKRKQRHEYFLLDPEMPISKLEKLLDEAKSKGATDFEVIDDDGATMIYPYHLREETDAERRERLDSAEFAKQEQIKRDLATLARLKALYEPSSERLGQIGLNELRDKL